MQLCQNVAIHSKLGDIRDLQNSAQHNYKYTEHSSGAVECGSAWAKIMG